MIQTKNFKEALDKYPDDDKKRHRYGSCLLTRSHLGIPVPLVSGPYFELAMAVYRGVFDWEDIERDLSANLEGTRRAYNLLKSCEDVAEGR